MHAHLEGEVLRVDAERVVPQGLEHGVPLQPLEPPVDVVPRERIEVADVQPFRRRVGEHHQLVERTRAIEVGGVRAALCPAGAPLGLHGGRVVADGLLGAGRRMRNGHRGIVGVERVPRESPEELHRTRGSAESSPAGTGDQARRRVGRHPQHRPWQQRRPETYADTAPAVCRWLTEAGSPITIRWQPPFTSVAAGGLNT